VDLHVGQLDRRHQPCHVGAALPVDLERPGQHLLLGGLLEVLDHGLDRHAARHLARGVPAHAVGHDDQPLVDGQMEEVLVVRPGHPDVGLAGEAHTHAVERERRAHGPPRG
jgi:hypothetical protein